LSFVDNVEVKLRDRTIPLTIAGSGRPCLFVHGYPLSRRMWHRVVDDLRHDWLVIAPDLRGFGESGKETEAFSIADLAEDLGELITVLEIRQKITLIGLSMGGYVAFEFWDKFADRLQSLVLCDTRASADTEAARKVRLDAAKLVLEVGTKVVTFPMIDKMLCQKIRDTKLDLVKEVLGMFEQTPPSTIAYAQSAMAARRDFTPKLSDMHIPTLAICGENDEMTPAGEMKSMIDKMPQATLSIIPDAGHLPPMENAQATVAAIRKFLQA
jgi:3-oxoadipate enol-lactonase